jgi:hypothetical protein
VRDEDALRSVGSGLAEVLQEKLDLLQSIRRQPEEAPPAVADDEERPAQSAAPEHELSPELAFTPRLFAQLCLPYRNPGDVPRWVRRNGALTLTVRPGQWYDLRTGELCEGYPYGVLPRLVVIWMATEATKTQERELLLGPSLTAFMGKLIIGKEGRSRPGGGPLGSFGRLGDQLRRMLTASVVVLDRRQAGAVIEDRSATFRFAAESRLWWSATASADHPLWESTITLSEEFFESIRAGSVPLPIEGLAALRARTSSPMALDIYVWLAHRLRTVKNPTPPISWADLAQQFGGDYAQVRQFKAQFLKELAHVLAVYPTANVVPGPKGLVLRRSRPPAQELSR